MTESDSPAPHPLTGPVFGPAQAGGARRLCVLLHGVGADGRDLIALAPHLAGVLPDAAFVAPDGPEPCDMAPFGRQWFSLQDRRPEALADGVERVRPDVDAFLDGELAGRGLAPDDLVLVGFSQGAMTALHVGLRRRPGPAAIVSFSGALIAPERLAAEIADRPPVLLVHGAEDDVVPPDALPRAEEALKAAGVPVEAHLCPGVGHGIDDGALMAAGGFLARVMKLV